MRFDSRYGTNGDFEAFLRDFAELYKDNSTNEASLFVEFENADTEQLTIYYENGKPVEFSFRLWEDEFDVGLIANLIYGEMKRSKSEYFEC